MGITKTKKAKKLLEKKAPKGEQLAYINDKEARLLKILGGAGVNIKGTGIKSYYSDTYGEDMGSSYSSTPSGPSGPDGPDGSDYYNEVSYVAPTPAPTPTVSVFDDDPFQDTNPAGLSDPPGTFTDSSPNPVDEVALTGNIPTTKSIFDDDPFQNTNPAGLSDTGKSLYVDSINDPFRTVGINNVIPSFNPVYDTAPPPTNVAPKGFFGTIGDVTKKVALGAGELYLNSLTGGKFSKAKRTLQAAKFIDKKFNQGKGEKAFTTALTNTPKGPGSKNPGTGFDDNDGGGSNNNVIAKNVVASNIEKYSPTQINSLQNNISLLESVLNRGSYQGTRLNSSQLSQVNNQRNSLIEEYNRIQEFLV